MSDKKDYYEILGVERVATPEEIKRAYRALRSEWHPDRNKDPTATDRMAEIQEAYEALYDPVTRENYDQTGEAKLPPLEQQARAHVVELIVAYATGELEGKIPMRGWLNGVLSQELQKFHENLREGERFLAKLERVSKRIKFKGEGTDFVGIAFDGHISSTKAKIQLAKENVERGNLCLKYAALYDYELEVYGQTPILSMFIQGPRI